MAKLKYFYDKSTAHFVANKEKYTPEEAARLACEQGLRPDIDGPDQIGECRVAWRFNEHGARYVIVDPGTPFSIAAWCFPVLEAGNE